MNCCLDYTDCNDSNSTRLFSLGSLPLGNPVSDKTEVWNAEFELKKCNRCHFIQTVNKVPFDKLADENYYVSSISQAVLNHYQWMKSYIEKFDEVKKEDLILEIGCGDGALLNLLYEAGYKTLIGVEPNNYGNKNNNYELIQDFFNKRVSEDLVKRGKRPKLIILNSVIETIPDLGTFFKDLFGFMQKGTLFFIEVPHFVAYINTKRIDAFSHLTSNWFTVTFFDNLAKRFHLEWKNVSIDSYRGGSIYLMGLKLGDNEVSAKLPEEVIRIIDEEKWVLGESTMNTFNDELENIKSKLNVELSALKSNGYILCGYGGGLKASSLLNWLNVPDLDFVVDKDPYKVGKFIPNLNIPIQEIQSLKSQNAKIVVINLAINFQQEVEQTLLGLLRNGDVIVHLLPNVNFVEVIK